MWGTDLVLSRQSGPINSAVSCLSTVWTGPWQLARHWGNLSKWLAISQSRWSHYHCAHYLLGDHEGHCKILEFLSVVVSLNEHHKRQIHQISDKLS